MNRYRLSSPSDHWWYPTAVAGTLSAAAVGAIFIVPLMGAQASPVQAPTEDAGTVTLVERPCYLTRADWHTPARWQHPVCTTQLRRGVQGPARGSHPIPAGYLP